MAMGRGAARGSLQVKTISPPDHNKARGGEREEKRGEERRRGTAGNIRKRKLPERMCFEGEREKFIR